jgi:GntR family transcriptional regulator, transcriptional repressor for pyruvate dehydrogenase complex
LARARATAKRRPREAPRREKPQQIADELRRLILSGELSEGDSLGHEPELVERFGVSRPSLREALRILEAEGLITVVRGVLGGVVVHEPHERMAARTAALVLQARNVGLADVHEARMLIEPGAVRVVAASRFRRAAADELQALIDEQLRSIAEPEAFAPANARFHDRLVALAGNQTLTIVARILNEIVERAVLSITKSRGPHGSVATRRRALRTQEEVVSLIRAGKAPEAEAQWRAHMAAALVLIRKTAAVVDLDDH